MSSVHLMIARDEPGDSWQVKLAVVLKILNLEPFALKVHLHSWLHHKNTGQSFPVWWCLLLSSHHSVITRQPHLLSRINKCKCNSELQELSHAMLATTVQIHFRDCGAYSAASHVMYTLLHERDNVLIQSFHLELFKIRLHRPTNSIRHSYMKILGTNWRLWASWHIRQDQRSFRWQAGRRGKSRMACIR